MNDIQTAVTVGAILFTVGGYLLSMYGIYLGQSSGSDTIDVQYIAGPTTLNGFVVIYLLYYLLYVRGDKHTIAYKILGTFLLIIGLILDIYLNFSNKDLRPTKAATGLLYAFTSINFVIRLFFIIQFHCTDYFGRKVKAEPQQKQQKQQQKQQQETIPPIGGRR
jgi:peptidoglycan biosynthesis protein MviN/MurJ (putative lipid II flippase)